MIINDDIESKYNIYYDCSNGKFIDNINYLNKQNIIFYNKPIIYINTLHSCYIHMIEDVFRIYWILDELLKEKYIDDNDVIFFINKRDIIKFYDYNIKVIDNINKCYINSWNDLFKIINKNEIIFEHLLEKDNILHFDKLFILNENDMWQRSFWNSNIYYPGRDIPSNYIYNNLLKYNIIKDNNIISRVRYDDNTIKQYLLLFRESVLKLYMNNYDDYTNKTNNIIIIDRKYNRCFPTKYLDSLIGHISNNNKLNYKGIYNLEDITFKDQVKLFNTNDIFIMMHGAGCGNMIWSKKTSLLIQYDNPNKRIIMYNRLCNLLDIDYYNIFFGYNDNIFELITNIINRIS
jgi:hypothetical protein